MCITNVCEWINKFLRLVPVNVVYNEMKNISLNDCFFYWYLLSEIDYREVTSRTAQSLGDIYRLMLVFFFFFVVFFPFDVVTSTDSWVLTEHTSSHVKSFARIAWLRFLTSTHTSTYIIPLSAFNPSLHYEVDRKAGSCYSSFPFPTACRWVCWYSFCPALSLPLLLALPLRTLYDLVEIISQHKDKSPH